MGARLAAATSGRPPGQELYCMQHLPAVCLHPQPSVRGCQRCTCSTVRGGSRGACCSRVALAAYVGHPTDLDYLLVRSWQP